MDGHSFQSWRRMGQFTHVKLQTTYRQQASIINEKKNVKMFVT